MKAFIHEDIEKAVKLLQADSVWPSFEIPDFVVERPNDNSHGDFASNIAMQLAKELKKNPLEIAKEIAAALTGTYDDVTVAPPGFLNFTIGGEAFGPVVQEILEKGKAYGSSDMGKDQKVLLEFISANPTGPLTLPNGRGGYLGDVLSNVYAHLGYNVVREYYINDRGNQIDILGESVLRRYLKDQGINVDYDENLYQGEYLSDLAKKLDIKDVKLTKPEKMKEVKDDIKQQALALMLAEIQRVITHKMEIEYDNWFSEKAMYDQGLPEVMMEKLREKDAVYEKDGAVWLRTSEYGDDKDRVLVKSDGKGAYMQGDVALYYNRAVERNVNKVILVLGADHHGYEKRLKALPHLLKLSTEFDLIFTQMATLMKDGGEVRMSKRRGNFVTIEELIDEVGNDVTRFFFLMYSSDRPMTFDLTLAAEHSDKNPVYYVQYAHARMCSILRQAEKEGVPESEVIAISHKAEKALVKEMMKFPEIIREIHDSYEVHHLATYAQDLARAFHHFYSECRVIDNDEVFASRYKLVLATKGVLAQVLGMLGVSAPEQM